MNRVSRTNSPASIWASTPWKTAATITRSIPNATCLCSCSTFISSEIHKGFGPLWDPSAPDVTKESARTKLGKRFDIVEETLSKQPYLTGETFSIANVYLFTIVNWAGMLKVDLTPWPKLQAFMTRVAARPKVQAALKEEGLIK